MEEERNAHVVRRETVQTFHVPEARVVTIPNAVDPRRLRPLVDAAETRRQLRIPADHRVILSLGALTWAGTIMLK